MPPLTGVAMNVTFVPEQTAVALATILTLAATEEVTVIVIEFDVVGEPVTQPRLDVILTVTTSLFTSELVVYVGAFVPTLDPLTCH